jgi:hypothetical protein
MRARSHFDAVSLSLTRGFVGKLLLYAWFSALCASWLPGKGVGPQFLLNFRAVCLVSIPLSVVAALLKKELALAPSLNHWDEALAFSAVTLLAHRAILLLVPT